MCRWYILYAKSYNGLRTGVQSSIQLAIQLALSVLSLLYAQPLCTVSKVVIKLFNWQCDKSRILAGRYQVPDVVFPKHCPTFCPRLLSSAMLSRSGTRAWIHRSRQCSTVLNSAVPRRLDSAFKRFRPASRWHLKITNTIDPCIYHRNLRPEWDPLPSTIPILSHDQKQRLLPNSNQTTGFQRRKAMRVVGVACMKRTPARNYCIPVQNGVRLSWDPWIGNNSTKLWRRHLAWRGMWRRAGLKCRGLIFF